ncbi:SDR family oxidoreductase [Paramixta manurensis]|uniref:SDR family oxidoreductase n=1 Tax=Paramixta manurensis TaxID=2740817 RepID=A0A6M8UE00_9GAMM|nr:SDR family oxidoreductase [Erwiniaceae bacterium PD-1]
MTAGQLPVAIVTGAASGMGKAVVNKFLQQHWEVIAIDVAEMSPQPAMTTVIADITDYAALRESVVTALNGRTVNTLVNAAGIFPLSTLATGSESLYRRIFDVNVLGTINIAKVAADCISEQGGAFLFFASVDAFAVSPGQLFYSASKAAVVSLTKSLAVELVTKGIVVNAVAPGWVETEGTLASGRIQEGVKTVPMKRAATVHEIADWVWTFSAAPGYITGETVVISGGSYMR